MATKRMNESDILKALVRKGALTDLCKELNTQILSSARANNSMTDLNGGDPAADEQRDQVKQIGKIWHAMNKLIRSQANKGRIIDSLYFGSFGKTNVMTGDENSAKTYTYCPGPRSVFKLVENCENMKKVPQEIIDKHLVTASFQSIADVCNCGSDMVQAVFQLIRDEIIDQVQQHKREVTMNLPIGQLVLGPHNSVVFRSLSQSEVIARQQAMSTQGSVRLTEGSLRGLERPGSRNSSQKNLLDDRSIAERSINYMQTRQSTASVGSRVRRNNQTNSRVANGDQIFQQNKQQDIADRLKGNTEDAPYFQRRMQKSRGQSMQHDTYDPLAEREKAPVNHSHLDNFLRDQVLSQKGGRGQRSTLSVASSTRNKNIIEMAAANQYNQRKKSMVVGNKRHDTAADTTSLVNAANVMRTSNYQADPLAAMMNTRSIGLNQLGVTHDQKRQNKEFLNRSLKVGNEKLHGLQIDPTDMISKASSRVVSPRIFQQLSDVEQALYRKKISNNYHTAVPKFMRSQGPFAVYDHAQHKGAHSYDTVGNVNEQALARYNEQSKDIQRLRETEKHQFYQAMEYADRMEYLKAQDRKVQNAANRDFLRAQIQDKQARKEVEKAVEILYYKPHFGPEETLVQVQKNLDAEKQKKDFVKLNLNHQINAHKELSEASKKQERSKDQKFIRATTNAQCLEHAAMQRKDQIMKANLRETWQRQMEIKTQHKKCDNYFK